MYKRGEERGGHGPDLIFITTTTKIVTTILSRVVEILYFKLNFPKVDRSCYTVVKYMVILGSG